MVENTQPKKRQTMRLSDSELELIRGTFKDNDDIIKTLRKVFLQMPLSAVDLSMLSIVKGKELHKVLRKLFLPELEWDIPINQQIDLFLTVQLRDMIPEIGAIHIKSVKRWIDYTEQQLNVLKNGNFQDKQKIQLKDFEDLDTTDLEIYMNMLARNTIISQTEAQLNQLWILSNQKPDEKPEETIKRLLADSSK
jgi:hypothetical protein